MSSIRTILNNYNASGSTNKTTGKHLMYLYLLDYIKTNCPLQEVSIANNIRLEYLSDFYGLLKHYGGNPTYDYINLLLNGYESSNEFNGEKSKIVMLNELDSKIVYINEKIKKL